MPKERKWSPRTRIIYCLPAFCGRLKMKAIIILLLSIILLVVSAERHGRIKPKERIKLDAYDQACPNPVSCPTITPSNRCNNVPQFFIGENGICGGCGTCVENTPVLDQYGCPKRICPPFSKPKNKRCKYVWVHQQFIVYNNRLCQDCKAYTCHRMPSNAFNMGLVSFSK